MAIKVVICDDNSMMRKFLAASLQSNESISEIHHAENGRECLDIIMEEEPQVVILDIEMPIMDGIAVLKEIRARRAIGRISPDLKVIVLSGTMYKNDANVRRAIYLGAFEVMAKPDGKSLSTSVDIGRLLAAIESAVR